MEERTLGGGVYRDSIESNNQGTGRGIERVGGLVAKEAKIE
jgi:hypothetical protein